MQSYRHILATVALLAAVFAGISAAPRVAQCTEPVPRFATDAEGRQFRVAFNLHERLVLDYGVLGGDGFMQRVRTAYKTTMGLDFEDERIWWHFRHTLVDLDMRWAGDTTHFRPTAVRAQYLRHDENSFVVIPTAQNIKFPAPFDMGVEFTLASFDVSYLPDGDSILNGIDVADIVVLFEFIRDPNYRHRLALSPIANYRAWRVNDGSGELSDDWEHQMVPLTSAELLYAWESATGRYLFDIRGRWAKAITAHPNGEWDWETQWSAKAHAEVIVLSVNDRPLSIPFGFGIEQRGAGDVGWQAFGGLRVSFWEGW